MRLTTLILVRHAHTEANDLGTRPMLAGWADIPLSAAGERQAGVMRRRFAPPEGGPIYSSDSIRSLRTAEALAGGMPIVRLRGLREIGCGQLDGLPLHQVRELHPEVWKKNEAQSDPDFAWPGGESYNRFRRRVVRTLGGIAQRHPGQDVVVVTHAGVISQIIGFAHGLSPARWRDWRPANCSVTVLQWSEEGPRLVRFDDRSYLEELSAAQRQRGG